MKFGRRPSRTAPLVALLMLLLMLLLSLPAQATLGGAPERFTTTSSTSIEGGAQFLADTTSSVAPFTVQESVMDSGTIVREYVAPSGIVFAVVWQGPSMPDLRRLLGDTYFAQYQQAADVSRTGRGSLIVNRPALMVQSVGHLRAFSGKAFVPKLLPRGVTVDQIR